MGSNSTDDGLFDNKNGLVNGDCTNHRLPVEIVATIAFLVISVGIAFCLAYERVKFVFVEKKKDKRNMVDYLTAASLISSSIFNYFTITLLVSSQGHDGVCSVAMLVCLTFYFGTKAFLYLLFIEKAYLANKFLYKGPRYKFRLYQINMALYSVYGIIYIMCVLNLYTLLTTSGTCVVALRAVGSWTVFAYDTLFSMYITLLFARPLMQRFGKSSINVTISATDLKMKQLAQRCLLGSSISLLSSFINVISLGVLVEQPLWLCITGCSTDVAINSWVAHYLTKMKRAKPSTNSSGGSVAGQGRAVFRRFQTNANRNNQVHAAEGQAGIKSSASSTHLVIQGNDDKTTTSPV